MKQTGREPMGEFTSVRKFFIAGCYIVLLGVAGFLLFFRLDGRLLWGDEAETAVLAKNVLQFGVPQTCDGTNYLILHGTVDETAGHVWIWSPWLQEYLAAVSFRLWGPTTWAARAPFALIGWGSLLALALVAYRIYRSHWVALAGVALLGSSEIFLLHARQCRYYPISVLGEVVLLYGVQQLLARNRRGLWLAALALSLQFYSNYIVAVANLPALFFLAWKSRQQGMRVVRYAMAIPGILAVAALPWLVYAHPWRQIQEVGGENYFREAGYYLGEFHFHFVPLCFLLLPLLGLITPGRDRQTTPPAATRQWEQFLLFLLPSYFAVILFAPGFYLRYLLPLLPAAVLLAAAWIFRHVPGRALAVLVVVILVASNAISVATAYPVRGTHAWRFPLVEYVEGLVRPYTNRFAGVLEFFKAHARPGEKVLVSDPEFPLIFYTPLGIIDGRMMAPAPGQLPDWILPASASGIAAPDGGALPEHLKPRYEMITISVPDSLEGDSIPEPDLYQYRTAPTMTPFVIYRLRAGADGR
jgi:4-amino-4-deoxy-L-arabinose transferase-like glycosyltransferase